MPLIQNLCLAVLGPLEDEDRLIFRRSPLDRQTIRPAAIAGGGIW